MFGRPKRFKPVDLMSTISGFRAFGGRNRAKTLAFLDEVRMTPEERLEWLMLDAFCAWWPMEQYLAQEYPDLLRKVYHYYETSVTLGMSIRFALERGAVSEAMAKSWSEYAQALRTQKGDVPGYPGMPDFPRVIAGVYSRLAGVASDGTAEERVALPLNAMLAAMRFTLEAKFVLVDD